MIRILYLFLLFFVITGCAGKKGESKIPVISLSHPEAEQTFNINEIVSNLRIIPLETHPEALLPEFFKVWVGKDYILILGREEILMFSSEGKFLRKVAQQGRGPEEFVSLMNYDVDEARGRLYLSDGAGTIDVIDLVNGGVILRFHAPSGCPQNILVAEDHSLAAFFTLDGSDILCRLDTLLNLTWFTQVPRQQDFPGSFYLAENEEMLRYKLGFCDTLYIQKDTMKLPYCCITTEDPYITEKGQGNSVEIVYENEKLFMLRQNSTEVHKYPGGSSSSTMTVGTYLCDKTDFSLKKVTAFRFDMFDYSHTRGFPFEIRNKKAAWNLSVAEYKGILKDRLENPAVADSLKTLYHELQEEDNPVLLVGDVI